MSDSRMMRGLPQNRRTTPVPPERADAPPPSVVRNTTDPGDATGRNFRYQHTYGVILLAAGKRGHRPYVALWCEHHEDFLAERRDGRFDGYQIKTSRPELGAWSLSDEDLTKSIGRFLDLVAGFGDHIAELFFVSNTEYDEVTLDSTNDKKRGRCPRLFLEHVKRCAAPEQVAAPFDEPFRHLQAECGCTADELLSVLHKMDLILGPSRGDFDAVVAHEHLGQLDGYDRLTPAQLDEFRDRLVALVHRASSLQVTDPRRHLHALLARQQEDPTLMAKRLVIEHVVVYQSDRGFPAPFQFPGEPSLALGTPRTGSVLDQKLIKGGLEDDMEYMKERERAAEYNLLEDVTRRPDAYPTLLQQIEKTVLGECQEANLRARQSGEPYGPAMLIDIQNRLRQLASDRPAVIGYHSYECLIGVAGLLTSACRVWWSPRFPISQEAHNESPARLHSQQREH